MSMSVLLDTSEYVMRTKENVCNHFNKRLLDSLRSLLTLCYTQGSKYPWGRIKQEEKRK